MPTRPARARPVRRVGVVALAALAALVALAAGSARGAQPAPEYEVDAIRYGYLPNFPVRSLVACADSARRMDIALMVWLARGTAGAARGHTVLVDAGFYHERFVRRWKPTEFAKPSDAVAAAGVRPEDVTDLVISHIHWDHADGVDLFPNARVWIQREEYEHYVGDSGRVKAPGIEPEVAAALFQRNAAGRVTLVADGQEILPGLTVHTGGRHTYASQFAAVRVRGGRVVLASDNLYLYENLARRVPIAQTLDSASNLRAQTDMLRLASHRRLIVPGHDPAVFDSFPAPGRGVARIAAR